MQIDICSKIQIIEEFTTKLLVPGIIRRKIRKGIKNTNIIMSYMYLLKFTPDYKECTLLLSAHTHSQKLFIF